MIQFVRDAPSVDEDSFGVSEIPRDDESNKKQLDSMTDRINKVKDKACT